MKVRERRWCHYWRTSCHSRCYEYPRVCSNWAYSRILRVQLWIVSLFGWDGVMIRAGKAWKSIRNYMFFARLVSYSQTELSQELRRSNKTNVHPNSRRLRSDRQLLRDIEDGRMVRLNNHWVPRRFNHMANLLHYPDESGNLELRGPVILFGRCKLWVSFDSHSLHMSGRSLSTFVWTCPLGYMYKKWAERTVERNFSIVVTEQARDGRA